MREKFRSTFQKGIITEPDVYAQPDGSVVDLVNFRITHLGGGRYKIKSIRGTESVFSLNPKYRMIGSWDCGEYAVIHSTNSTGFTTSNGEIGIVEWDGSGYVYTPLYNHKNIFHSLEKYVQSRIYKNNQKDHQVYWWNNAQPPRVLNVKDPTLYTLFDETDTLTDGSEYMVVSGNAEYPPGSGDFYGPDEALGTVFQVVAPDLDFDDPNNTSPRVILYEPKVEMIDLIPKIIDTNDIKFVQRIGPGDLKTGMWFYFVQYEYNNEVRTAWSTGTTGIHISEGVVAQDDFMSYLEYQGMGGETGIPNDPDQNTGFGIRIRIDNINDKYTKLRVAAVRATDYRTVEQPVLIAEVNISPGDTSITVDHTAHYGILQLADTDIIEYTEGIVANKTGDIVKGYLFLGNITKRLQFDWDPQPDARITPIAKDLLHDSVSESVTVTVPLHPDETTGIWASPNELPLHGHALRSTFVYAYQWYKVTGTGADITVDGNNYVENEVFMYDGASGPRAAITVNAGTPIVKPCIVKGKYTGVREIIEFDDWYDMKGMMVNHELRSRFRGETYRCGIMLFDPWGIYYGVAWLGDVVMPKMNETVSNTTDIDNPVNLDATLLRTRSWPFLTTPGKMLHYVQSLGVKVDDINFNTLLESINAINDTDYDIEDLPDLFSGFSIVFAPRDEQLIAQGIVFPLFLWSDTINAVLAVSPMGCDALLGAATGPYNQLNLDGFLEILDTGLGIADPLPFIRVPNNYEFLSPDFLMKFNNDLPQLLEGDKVEIVAHLSDPGKILDEYGTMHTEPFHIYSKMTSFNDDEADGMVPLYAQTNVDVAKSRDLTETTPHLINVSGTDQIFFNWGLVYDRITPYLRVGIGGKKFILVTEADETGADPDWANGISYHGYAKTGNSHILAGAHKCLVNIIRPKSNLYGGQSQSALEATTYMPCGHFQKFDQDFIDHLLDTSGGKSEGFARGVEVFGGDAYVGLFDFCRIVQFGDETTKLGPPLAALGYPGAGGTLTEAFKYSHSVIFPVETKINLGLREGRHISKDRSAGDLVTPAVSSNPEGVAFGTGLFNNPESLRYNEAYSTDFIFALYPAAKKQNYYNNHYPNRYIWSRQASVDDVINALRQFAVLNKKDVSGVFGEIVQMCSKLDRLFYWQKYGAGYIGVDERAMIPNSLSQMLTMGVLNAGERYDQIEDDFGLQHQSAHAIIKKGFAWFDQHRKALLVMSFSGQEAQLEIINPNQSLLGNILDNEMPHDNPLMGEGYVLSYNPRLDEIMLHILPGEFYFDVFDPEQKSYYTLGYNLTEKIFSTRTTHAAGHVLNFNNRIFTQSSDMYPLNDVAEIANSTVYQEGDFALNGEELIYCITSHTSPAGPASPYVPANWQVVQDIAEVHINDESQPSRFHGITHQGVVRFIVNPTKVDAETLCFYNFLFMGMTSKFFRSVIVKNSHQIGADNDVDISPTRDYEYRDRKWVSSVPLASDSSRMVDGYMEVILIADNREEVDGERDNFTNDGSVIELISVINEFRKEY